MTSCRGADVPAIWDEAERVAPQCSTMAQVGRVVDSIVDEPLSDSRWASGHGTRIDAGKHFKA